MTTPTLVPATTPLSWIKPLSWHPKMRSEKRTKNQHPEQGPPQYANWEVEGRVWSLMHPPPCSARPQQQDAPLFCCSETSEICNGLWKLQHAQWGWGGFMVRNASPFVQPGWICSLHYWRTSSGAVGRAHWPSHQRSIWCGQNQVGCHLGGRAAGLRAQLELNDLNQRKCRSTSICGAHWSTWIATWHHIQNWEVGWVMELKKNKTNKTTLDVTCENRHDVLRQKRLLIDCGGGFQQECSQSYSPVARWITEVALTDRWKSTIWEYRRNVGNCPHTAHLY